jgi:diaminohydroxyphosphoribosylaminopyrimidine deaminase/5-amino-6-(5-phosphoribosylamino)uracil reductase
LTHQWRAQEDAILIGVNSVINDDPQLTAREFEGKQPLRILIDSQLRCPSNRKVFDNSAKTVVVNTIREDLEINNPLWMVDKDEPIAPQVLARLGELEVNSLIIEGGRTTLQHFIDHGLWDEARILTGANPIDGHDPAPQIKGSLWESFEYGPDQIEIFGKR